jgi:hypothetical protein
MYSQAWKDVLDAVDTYIQDCADCVWFRGHSEKSYLLKSGLFRVQLPTIDEYIKLERKMYTYYKDMGYLLHDKESGWQLLYSLQHHGGKTRLLDWTESFPVALYFAARNWTSGNACIWLLQPRQLNLLSLGLKEIISPFDQSMYYPEMYLRSGMRNSIAIYPIKNTTRIGTQHGIFTVQGNGMQSLDEECNQYLLKNGYLKKIELQDYVRDDVLRFIRQSGITHFSLFPELDGLATYLNKLLIKKK